MLANIEQASLIEQLKAEIEKLKQPTGESK